MTTYDMVPDGGAGQPMPDFMTMDAGRLDRAMQASAPHDRPLKDADPDAAALFDRAMDAGRMDRAMQAPAPHDRPLKDADPDAAALFEHTLDAGRPVMPRKERPVSGKRGADAGPAGSQRHERSAEGAGAVLAGMSHPLDTLFGSDIAGSPHTEIPTKPFPADMADLVNNLVERILVASPPEGHAEVRITLGEGRLRKTEIRLVRTGEGQLDISLHTADDAAFHTLDSARDALQKRLHAVGEHAHIAVSTGSDEGDTSRRSRGYTGFFSASDEEKSQ